MPTKKVRKNRYMRRMQSRRGRLSWGMPFPARLRRSHREHACRVHLLAATSARTCPARDRPRRRRSSRPANAGPTCGAGCAERKVKEERGEVVYRPSAAPAAPRRSANCRAQRGRSCEQGASEGGDFSLIGSPFFSGKKLVIGSRPRSARCAKPSSERTQPSCRSGRPK